MSVEDTLDLGAEGGDCPDRGLKILQHQEGLELPRAAFSREELTAGFGDTRPLTGSRRNWSLPRTWEL